MSGNTFGELFRVTTFGESHGLSLGCIIDGCPAGIALDAAHIQQALNRRKPGTGERLSACRKESDLVENSKRCVLKGKTTSRHTDCACH